MDKYINTPITEEVTKNLKSVDYVYLTGTIYVARDAAHKRMIEALERGEELPIDIKDSTIYYMGPSPAREGRPIGSAGPTTATRMDKYAPTLLDLGEKAMIGKGKRNGEVMEAIVRNKAVYFAAVGGAGALLSKSIIDMEASILDIAKPCGTPISLGLLRTDIFEESVDTVMVSIADINNCKIGGSISFSNFAYNVFKSIES